MSIHGVRQMKEFLIRYSDYDGSSRGIIEWMRTSLVTFASSNPDVKVVTEIKRNKHPFLRGIYQNGNSKTICVKNLDPTKINDFALYLRNQAGKRVSYEPLLRISID